MSYILDALRKSDQQRQLGAAPTLQMGQMVAPEPKQRAYLPYGLLAVVLLCAGIAIGWLRPWQAQQAAPAVNVVAVKPPEASVAQPVRTEAVPATVPVAPTPSAPSPTPAQIAPPPAPAQIVPAQATAPAPVSAPVLAKVAAPAKAPVPVAAPARTAAPASTAAPKPAPVSPPGSVTAAVAAKSHSPTAVKAETVGKAQDVADAIPAKAPTPEPPVAVSAQKVIWLAELPLALQQELPPMAVSVHAYSARPADRMVGINNRMLREGEFVVPGLKLEQITQEGMVFGYKGYSFRRGVK